MFIAVVIIGMLGWTMYDFLSKPNETTSADEEIQQVQSDSLSDEETKEDSTTEPTIGLNVNDTAPDFELTTLAGETVKLSDFRGQRVMLNFWATWCPPCRAEMPDIQKFHQDNGDIAILAINLTKTEPGLQQVQDFADEFELTFPILLDKQINVAANYEIRPIPTSFMIDSNGVIQFNAFGPLTYDMMVEKFAQMQ